jgi:hypothetical protein
VTHQAPPSCLPMAVCATVLRMILVDRHWVDDVHPDDSKARRRTMIEHCHYVDGDGVLRPADYTVRNVLTTHCKFDESFPRAANAVALECLVGDDKSYGIRRPSKPNLAVKFKAVDWPSDVELTVEPQRGGVKETITVRSRVKSLTMVVELPANLGMKLDGQVLRFFDSVGAEIFYTVTPWAHDSATVGYPVPWQVVGVTMSLGKEVDGNPTILLTLDDADMERAVMPVVIDPTTSITGTSNQQDNWMTTDYNNYNNGASTSMEVYAGSSPAFNVLCRIATAAIPAGTITAFRAYARATYVDSGAIGSYYAIKDANDWSEGTKDYTTAGTGESCRGYCKYNTQAWAGSAGCNTSGTDFDADASPPGITYSTSAYASATLKTAWPTAWRDSTRVNNGMTVRMNMEWDFVIYNAKNASSNPSYYEIDYTDGGTSVFFPRMVSSAYLGSGIISGPGGMING